jgi:hypothetical protein
LRFLISRSGITKIAVAVLTVIVASAAAGIGYYATTHLPSPNVSSTPTPSPQPTATLPQTFTYTVTPTPKQSPTPTAASTPTPPPTPAPTNSINPTLTPTPSPIEITTQEKVRDAVMHYIKSNHPETSQFIQELVWTGGRTTPPNVVGAETYMYYSQGWNVTINYPVVPNAIYKIETDYSAIGISIPYRIIWKGTWQNEVLNETSYIFAQ